MMPDYMTLFFSCTSVLDRSNPPQAPIESTPIKTRTASKQGIPPLVVAIAIGAIAVVAVFLKFRV